MPRPSLRRLSALAVAGAAALALTVPALPAAADTLPTPGCTTCTATFDTIGEAFTFAVPANITNLTVTVAGAAGAAPQTDVLPGVGGTGGVTTVNLGTTYAGQTLSFGVGDVGGGSYISAPSSDLVVVVGGGGGGGYVGRLDLPDQVFATYPGGSGASPTVAGITNGQDAEGFTPGQPANGLGGNDAGGGAGGTGNANGTAGEPFTEIFPTYASLALGGAGATLNIPVGQPPADQEHVAGAGGGGLTGGGGGGIVRGLDGGDEILLDFVAPGGGGSGLLDDGLTGVAGEPNTGAAYVTFVYTVPALPSTGPAVSPWVPSLAILLLLGGAAALIVTRRARTV